MNQPDKPSFSKRRRTAVRDGLRLWLAGVVLAVGSDGLAVASPHSAMPAGSRMAPTDGLCMRVLGVNRLAVHVSNTGPFAWDILNGYVCGLEYPRGSGQHLAYTGGPWLIGIAGADTLTAISEFGWEFSPGPSTNNAATFDTLQNVVYRTACADTLGRAAWLARGVPIGAPLDDAGAPLERGDVHLWTRFTDAPGPWTADHPRYGLTSPIGVDVMLSAYAYDRPGPLSETVFLEYTLVHRGLTTLDSAWFGIFLDPMAGSRPHTSYDAALDLAIAYRALDNDPVYGATGPALGVLWLEGPRTGPGAPLRPTSFVVYPNGGDPASMADFLGAMRSVRPFFGPIIDPTTNQPSPWWSTGDPVSGGGWVDTSFSHPHTVLAAGPFRFAPGDTQHVAVALVTARASSRLESVTHLRSHAIAAAAAWNEGFANAGPCPPSPPPPPPATLGRVWPNPAVLTTSIGWRSTPGEPLRFEILDSRGRRVRSWRTVATQGPDGSTPWDLADDDGRRVPPGIYFVRVTGRGFERTARLVVLE